MEFTIHAVVKVPNFNIPSSIIYRQIEGGETGLSVVNGEMEFGCKASFGNCFTGGGWVKISTPIPDND